MLSEKFRMENVAVNKRSKSERGAAMAIAIIVVAILLVIALTALAFSSSEARIAGGDLQRTHAFYAAAAGMEKMTNDFSELFRRKMNPTPDDLNTIEKSPPKELVDENFNFDQNIEEDTDRLNELRAIQGLPNTVYPRVNIPDGPFAGLYASLVPYKMSSTALQTQTKAEVELEREFNNYLVPLFQFGMFSNEDIEIHPGPQFTFNGRIHTNGNLYAVRNTKFLGKVTIAGELVRDAMRSGDSNTGGGNDNIIFEVNGINVQSTIGNGSVKSGAGTVGGPNLSGTLLECVDILNCPAKLLRGYFPGSPLGIANTSWENESVKPAIAGTPNRFGGQVLTKTTGAAALKLPLETGGNNAAEVIKRSLTSDDEILSASRYHTKAEIRILIDDLNAGSGTSNVAGIPAGKGVLLKNDATGFNPLPLGNGGVLRRISNTGSYIDSSSLTQRKSATNPNDTETAMTVRGIKNIAAQTAAGNHIPAGSGVEGRIYIEVVKPDGTTLDVTQQILSMGMTQGEPNGIVYLQRPLWAAFVQGSRDRAGKNFDLANLTKNSQTIADGEITSLSPTSFAANRGYISMDISAANEDSGSVKREYAPSGYNSIVPINIYNVREGWVRSSMDKYAIYPRGLMSVVEINMRNLTRWLDGVYDNNLLAGTGAVSTNIRDVEGYVVYVSDRRGDRKNTEYLRNGSAFVSTNGIVDNEDIYGPNGVLDPGEDVIDFGWSAGGISKKGKLQKDILELPDSGTPIGTTPSGGTPVASRLPRAEAVLLAQTAFFRRAVRLFDGESLSITGTGAKLSPTKGITISSENPVHTWGNYNTTGITGIPLDGSTLNNGGYTGAQIPASIVSDAFFPLSKTWFDASSALYPEGVEGSNLYRKADESASSISQSTAVRTAIIAGATISAINGSPGRNSKNERIAGGIHNYPRFLELWDIGGIESPWNYTGSLVPLFHSTQAVSQYEDSGANIYVPPRRNWSFDETFLSPQKLPPGTPFFQYVHATGFRQKLY